MDKAKRNALFTAICAAILAGSMYIYIDHKIINLSYCRGNLQMLGKRIVAYASNNEGKLPNPFAVWEDVLLEEYGNGNEKAIFVCPEAKFSCYTLNKNLEDKLFNDIEPNTVLVFEGAKGWNQLGTQHDLRIRHFFFTNVLVFDGKTTAVKTLPFWKLDKYNW